MPSPSASQAVLRPDIAGAFTQFDLEQDRLGFIGTKVAPVIEVGLQSAPFSRMKVSDLLQNRDTTRAPGAPYSRSGYQFDSVTYTCKENGAEEPVDDRQAEMYRYLIKAELFAAIRARDVVLRNMEKRIAALVFNTGTWTGAAYTAAAATAWSTIATAVPLNDVLNAKKKIFDNSGLKANALIVGWKTFLNLINNTAAGQIVDRIKYSGLDDPKARGINASILAQLFDVDMVLVGDCAKNTAAEGQTPVVAGIWNDTMAMVAKVATSEDIMESCVARTFHWAADGSSIGATVESYRDERVRGDVMRARMDTDEIVMYKEAAFLITGV